MAVVTRARPDVDRPHTTLDLELRETEIRPPTTPPTESRGQPTPPRYWWWLVAVVAVAAIATVAVVLINSGDGVTGDTEALPDHYDAYTRVLGDGADAFVAQQQAVIEDVRTTIGGEATAQLDDYYRDYGIILLDGATSADYWADLAEAQARDHELDRFRTQAEWWSTVPESTYGHEVDRFGAAAEMWSPQPDDGADAKADLFERRTDL